MSQGNQLNNISSYDIDTIVKNINSLSNRLEGLSELQQVLEQGCSTASFLRCLEKLFSGLRQCLQSESINVDIVLKANAVLLEMISDIQHSDDLEIQYAQLMPVLIENLGSSKAVIRKSTHKCIATYVKLSKKLEFVLLHLSHTGLENQNTRTRQHSMLVIPALVSLKPQIVEKPSIEILEMIGKVVKRISDPQEIVSKTAKKLFIELDKCYPQTFHGCLVNALKNEDEKAICRAIIQNDEEELGRLLNANQNLAGGQSQQTKRYLEESKQQPPQLSTPQVQAKTNLGSSELSIVGREILQSTNVPQTMAQNSKKAQNIDMIISEAKEESRYPMGQNGLFFGFLDDALIEQLNEKNQWKERTNAIEAIESKLNLILTNEKKMDFLPYATAFLGFMLQYLSDINFKISLTTIKIIAKLLQANIINSKKYYNQLVTQLIEKLSDSKVIIRQQVLKCCALVNQHGNWHVREGVLHLIALSMLTQEDSSQISNNQVLIDELCKILENEDKQKIQQLIIDVLALALDTSKDQSQTLKMIQQAFRLKNNYSSYGLMSKEQMLVQQVTDRLEKGNLPFINEEGIIEFPQALSTKNLNNANQYSSHSESEKGQGVGETLSTAQTKTPSMNFMEVKRREEEKKANSNPYSQIKQQITKNNEPTNEKIHMWLPSFNNTPNEDTQHAYQSSQKDNNLNGISSSATMLDDGRSYTSSTTLAMSSQLKSVKANNETGHFSLKSPAFSENPKTMDNPGYQKNQFTGSQLVGVKDKIGYTPETHHNKPRKISSNEAQQRTIESESGTINQQESFTKPPDKNQFQKNSLNIIKSQSTGASGTDQTQP